MSRSVKDRVAVSAGRVEIRIVQNIANHKFHRQASQGLAPAGFAHQCTHLPAAIQQGADQMSADQAGRARHEGLHPSWFTCVRSRCAAC